jgi:hypothetical protein
MECNLNLNDFYSGGYILIGSDRPDWPPLFGDYLPPGNLLSLSTCFCPQRLSVQRVCYHPI